MYSLEECSRFLQYDNIDNIWDYGSVAKLLAYSIDRYLRPEIGDWNRESPLESFCALLQVGYRVF